MDDLFEDPQRIFEDPIPYILCNTQEVHFNEFHESPKVQPSFDWKCDNMDENINDSPHNLLNDYSDVNYHEKYDIDGDNCIIKTTDKFMKEIELFEPDAFELYEIPYYNRNVKTIVGGLISDKQKVNILYYTLNKIIYDTVHYRTIVSYYANLKTLCKFDKFDDYDYCKIVIRLKNNNDQKYIELIDGNNINYGVLRHKIFEKNDFIKYVCDRMQMICDITPKNTKMTFIKNQKEKYRWTFTKLYMRCSLRKMIDDEIIEYYNNFINNEHVEDKIIPCGNILYGIRDNCTFDYVKILDSENSYNKGRLCDRLNYILKDFYDPLKKDKDSNYIYKFIKMGITFKDDNDYKYNIYVKIIDNGLNLEIFK